MEQETKTVLYFLPIKEEALANLAHYRKLLAEHMKQKHNGILVSTCHACLKNLQGIRSNEWSIWEAEREEELLKNITPRRCDIEN